MRKRRRRQNLSLAKRKEEGKIKHCAHDLCLPLLLSADALVLEIKTTVFTDKIVSFNMNHKALELLARCIDGRYRCGKSNPKKRATQSTVESADLLFNNHEEHMSVNVLPDKKELLKASLWRSYVDDNLAHK